MTKTELARLADINKQTLDKLESGIMKVSRQWADKLAPHLRYTSEQLVFWDRFFPSGDPGEHIESGAISGLAEGARRSGDTVRLVGYVGAGAEAHFYAIAEGDLDEVKAPADATKDTVAVEVRGDSLGSFFNRWLVYYDDVRRPVSAELVNQLCVVGLADERVLVKRIRRAPKGLFDLESPNDEPIRGVAIDWAARVISMTPR